MTSIDIAVAESHRSTTAFAVARAAKSDRFFRAVPRALLEGRLSDARRRADIVLLSYQRVAEMALKIWAARRQASK